MASFQSLISAVFLLMYYYLTPLLAGIAILVFLWGLARFIFRVGGDEEAIKEGRNIMTWGLIALFVMFSVWGIVKFFQSSLGITNITL